MGVLFVCLPALNADDFEKLAKDSERRMDIIIERCKNQLGQA